MGPFDEIHGTRNGYTLGCRCDKCKDAQNVYRHMARKRGPLKTTEHGKLHTYTNLGCRCNECQKAAKAWRVERTLAKAGADDEGWIVS